jgi:seryl-tRNA synthetase
MYTVYQDINGYNSAADAAARKNPTTVNKKGEYYMYHKYPNGYNGMYNITKNPNSAGSWINPADNKKPDDIETLKKENAELKEKIKSLENQVEQLKSKISAAIDILK